MLQIIFIFSTLAAFAVNPCEPNPLCDELNDLSFACSEKWDEITCDRFTETFEKLLGPQNCTEPGKEIRFAFNSCEWKKGSTPSDLHFDRLARLPYAKAMKLYTSEKLRKTMDGMVAEIHFKKSKADEKLMGKSLFASKLIPECREFEYIDFNTVKRDLKLKGKSYPQYSYEEGKAGDYLLWMGDIPKKIINTKTKKECEVKTPGLLDKITKAQGADIVRYEMYEGSGKHWEALIDLKTCQPIWQSSWDTAETVSGESSRTVTVNKVQKSSWKKCEPCWNKMKAGCLRII